MKIRKTRLGRSDLMVTSLGLGCMGFSGSYDKAKDHNEAIHTLKQAYELGINFFDTADMYGDGHNECLLGEAFRDIFKNSRDSIVIATKCGFETLDDGSFEMNFSANYIKSACDASLKRLNLDYIDLYYLHRQPSSEEFDESILALIDLLNSEKIKNIGLSEPDVESIQKVYDMLKKYNLEKRFVAVQTEFSLFSQYPKENGILEICEKLGISFVPYSPLSRALLTPDKKTHEEFSFKEGDFRGSLPRFKSENLKHNLNIRDQLQLLAEEKKCSLAQLALSWAMNQGKSIIPIPGSQKINHIKSNIQSVDVMLSDSDFVRIDNIMKAGIKGQRYADEHFQFQNIVTS